MAFFFTGLQVLEYFGVSYTITDSVFGSTFYMGTGFHGYLLPLLIIILIYKIKLIYILLNNIIFPETNNKIDNNINNSRLILTDKNNNKFELNKKFLE